MVPESSRCHWQPSLRKPLKPFSLSSCHHQEHGRSSCVHSLLLHFLSCIALSQKALTFVGHVVNFVNRNNSLWMGIFLIELCEPRTAEIKPGFLHPWLWVVSLSNLILEPEISLQREHRSLVCSTARSSLPALACASPARPGFAVCSAAIST